MHYKMKPQFFMQKTMPSRDLCSCLKHDRHCITFYTEVIPPKRSTATTTLCCSEKGGLPTHRPDSSTYPILNLTNVQVMKSAQMISATSRLVRLYRLPAERLHAAKQTVPQLETEKLSSPDSGAKLLYTTCMH